MYGWDGVYLSRRVHIENETLSGYVLGVVLNHDK